MEALDQNWKEKLQNLDDYYKSYIQNKNEEHTADTNKLLAKQEKQLKD